MSNAGVLTIANNAVDFGQLALDVMQTVTINLTAAQIKGIWATPIQLIAAPGSGKLILVDSMLWDIHYGTVQYASGGTIAAQYGNTSSGGGAPASNGLTSSVFNSVNVNGFLQNLGIINSQFFASSFALNAAIYLSNQTAAFTTGDSTATLYVRYHIVTPT
jgi:hypothetical protein